ncbi:AAA family ATPase [Gordonia sp. UBA7599]|uniref:AAA family ATPase n=1 Tax=Gordonia sp. UBA7599 TaxID=1946578 RepID=UPI0025C0CD7B|nr:AAA family ATPase [Gordonia sp. UBA7599]
MTDVAPRPDEAATGRVLRRWVAREFDTWFYARLDGARFAQDARVPLGRVFVDLPCEGWLVPRLGSHGDPPPVLRQLLREETPSREVATDDPARDDGGFSVRLPEPWVALVGGPGQGKTTVGHFLLQLHRAALLRDARDELTDETAPRLDAFLEHAKALDFEVTEVRWPLHVPVPRCADWLVGDENPGFERTLEGFLCARIVRHTGERLAEASLRAWLLCHPWQLVLDGLDELGAAEARGRVVDAVRDFLRAMPEGLGRVLVATRPTGYGREFGDVPTLTLRNLTPEEAVTYGERLIKAWCGADVDRADRLRRRLTTAAREGAATEMFRTPLQVTILVALFGRISRAPVERWRLFRDYYATLYERELDRDHAAAEVLRRWHPAIDAIHAQAALHLQVMSETQDARMTQSALRAIVQGWLAGPQGLKDDALRRATEEIERAARERLVLLVENEPGWWSFELRSFQEFMAAEALLSAREHVADRLRAVAASPHWRNVLLFALSRLFAQPGELSEDLVLGLCDGLDAGPPEAPGVWVRAGAMLAIGVLRDGSAASFPRYMEGLVRRAFGVLHVADAWGWQALAELLAGLLREAATADELGAVVREEFDAALRDEARREAGWHALLELERRGAPLFAVALMEAHWPTDRASCGALAKELVSGHGMPVPSWLFAHADDWVWNVDPWPLLDSAWALPIGKQRHPLLMLLKGLGWGSWLPPIQCSLDGVKVGFSVASVPVQEPKPGVDFAVPDGPSAAWSAFLHAVPFWQSPSARTLGEALDVLANDDRAALRALADRAPWPLAACLRSAVDSDELRRLARRAARGALGDADAWRAAQERWSLEGMDEKDLRSWLVDDSWPFGADIAARGAVWSTNGVTFTGDTDARVWLRWTRALMAIFERAAPGPRRELARLLVNGWSIGLAWEIDDWDGWYEQVREVATAGGEALPLGAFLPHVMPQETGAWLRVLERVGRGDVWTPELMLESIVGVRGIANAIVRGLLDVPSPFGLLKVLALLPVEPSTPIPRALLVPEHCDDVAIRTCILLLRVRQLGVVTPSELDQVRAVFETPELAERMVPVLVQHLDPRTAKWPTELVALLLHRSARVLPQHRRAAAHYLRARRIPTALDDPHTWAALHFVAPSPRSLFAPPADVQAPSDDAVVELRRIAVRALRGIDAVELTLRSRDDGAPWLVVIGENGVGKSTLLRALAFALAPRDVVGGVVARASAPWCRVNADHARVEVDTSGGTFVAQLTRANGDTTIAQEGDGVRPFIVAYGCKRGSAFGGPEREVNLEPAFNVATLFEETAVGLLPASHWLTRRKLAELQEADPEGEAHAVLSAVLEVLCGPPDKPGTGVLDGVTRIDIRGDEVMLYGDGVGEAPLEALSDGYITMMGWTVDLMARWVEPRRKAGRSIPRRFNTVMTGVVLLDEIDLHLHPRWQYDVLPRIRNFFPRMTFVVTTHNPTTLLGARAGDIHVMRRVDDCTEVRPLDLPAGVRVDELLTGMWFGLTTTTDPETLALYEEHQQALRGGASFGAPELRALEDELRRRLKRFGDTALERIAHNVLASMPRTPGAAQTPEARAAMRAHVQEVLAREATARQEAARKSGTS